MISSTIKKINKISPNYSFNKWSIIILPLILISSILEMIGPLKQMPTAYVKITNPGRILECFV